MAKKVKVCVLRTAGTNCDQETAFAFSKVGALVETLHINRFLAKEKKLSDYHILALPGGFSYGDDIAAGRVLANELRFKLADDIRKFIQQGNLIIGICNGFQILVKSGLLPGNPELKQEVSLVINDSGKFEDRWVYLKSVVSCPMPAGRQELSVVRKCIWTKDLSKIIYLPVAHGEGKFIVKDDSVLTKLKNNGQIVFQYCDVNGVKAGYPGNPNGSLEDIAGICDDTGRIFGLMPHPERHIDINQHPRKWGLDSSIKEGDGLLIFRNGVEYARRYL